MRKFALYSVAALAVSMMASTAVWAWSTETTTSQDANSTNLADPEEALKALQNKVDSKSSNSQTGFFISGNVNQQPYSPFGYRSNQTDTGVPFGYSPMPGFRGQPQ